MVITVAPGFGGSLFIALIGVGKAAGKTVRNTDADFAVFAGSSFLAVGIEKMHVIQGYGLAHGADFMALAAQVADNQRAFGLTEALHDLQAGGLLELAENLRVQRLARNGGVLDGA